MEIPLGFRFCPTDEELIRGYLLKKIRGEELSWNGILEFDVYGEYAPWQIFGNLPDKEEEKFYVFTRQKRASKNRVARVAGCGTWHESYCEKIYENRSERIIGLKKLFCFKVKEGTCLKKTNWLMHEFSLAGEQEKTTDLVLCAIQNKGTETRNRVNRSSQNHAQIGQEPAVVATAETPCQETPENGVNTNLMRPEDKTQRGKRMRSDVESNAPQASEMPSECSTPLCITTESAPPLPSQSSMQTTELETHAGRPDAPPDHEMPPEPSNLMHEFSLAGEQEKTTDLVLYAIQNKGTETRNRVNRNSQNQTQIGQEPATVAAAETPYQETPENGVNTNLMRFEDVTRQGKRMRIDVESDVPQASEMPLVRSTPLCITTESAPQFPSQSDMQTAELETHASRPDAPPDHEMPPEPSTPCITTESAPNFPSQSNTQTTELETQEGRPLPCDASFSSFYASYGHLLPLPNSNEEWMEWLADEAWM